MADGGTRPIDRRRLLALGLSAAGIAAAAGCSHDAVSPPAPRPAGRTTPTTTTPASPPPTTEAPDGPAVEIVRAETGRAQVALTFHGAGELAVTRRVLDVLAAHGAQVTVLAVGTWLAASPDAASMVLDGGHELGNHTWDHPPLSTYAPRPTLSEITRCRDKIDELTGSPGAFFRQSQGRHATDTELLEAGKAGYHRVLSYDVDSLDWRDPGATAIRNAVSAARAGSIVSMHLGHEQTVRALPGVLSDLRERGLDPVTATELLR